MWGGKGDAKPGKAWLTHPQTKPNTFWSVEIRKRLVRIGVPSKHSGTEKIHENQSDVRGSRYVSYEYLLFFWRFGEVERLGPRVFGIKVRRKA